MDNGRREKAFSQKIPINKCRKPLFDKYYINNCCRQESIMRNKIFTQSQRIIFLTKYDFSLQRERKPFYGGEIQQIPPDEQ